MHELNHWLGVPDHYHAVDEFGICVNLPFCSDCGPSGSKRPATCVMGGNSHAGIAHSGVMCSGCGQDLEAHLKNGNH